MFLTETKLTATTYSARVEGNLYTVDVTGFPPDKAVAMAIEEIRTQVRLGAPAPSAPAEPPLPEPAKPRQRRVKIDTAPVPNE